MRKHACKTAPPAGAALALALMVALGGCGRRSEVYVATTVAMDTVVEQRAYGPNAQDTMREVNLALDRYEARLSMYGDGGDIARVNEGAGGAAVPVEPETAALVAQVQRLSAQGKGAYAFTIAPITLAWGVQSDVPRVPSQTELDALLPLVNDAAVEVGENSIRLPVRGMGIDLGGFAKGAACNLAADIYTQNGVDSALLWVGGNVYAHGVKPGGEPFSVGFADPGRPGASIASFDLTDECVAISDGSRRYFEAGGRRYIHIFNPATGRPAESDIISVGVLHADGAEADFWSTALFVGGLKAALDYLRGGGRAIILAQDGALYVSQSLKGNFELHTDGYTLEFV